MNPDEFLTALRSVLEHCSHGRFGEATRMLDSIDWRMVERYEPEYGALFALTREAAANVPRALEDAKNLYNEIIYRQRIQHDREY